jgi:L-fuculose-phosphate aldolase
MDGKVRSQRHKKSMEINMHLAIYKKRPDIKAIVHAHPVFATSFAISNKLINTNIAGETRAILGEPAMAEYALMGTQKLADLVAEALSNSNVVLMRNHGVITLGDSLFQAFDRMEVLEACAKMSVITEMLGGSHDLNVEQLKEIDNLFI